MNPRAFLATTAAMAVFLSFAFTSLAAEKLRYGLIAKEKAPRMDSLHTNRFVQ